MNVKPATKNPLATEEIGGMIDMIQTLIDKGYAYERMEQFITVPENLKGMESCHIKIWTICSPADVPFL